MSARRTLCLMASAWLMSFGCMGARGTAKASALTAGSREPVPVQPALFELRMEFWGNLHQVLLYEGARLTLAQPGSQRRGPPRPPAVSTEGLSAEEAATWNAAVAVYARTFGSRFPFLEPDIIQLTQQVAALHEEASPRESGIRPEIAEQLEKVAGLYRQRFWPEHERTDQEWVKALEPLLREKGEGMAGGLQRLLRATWPPSPVRVDVAVRAGPFAAYTTEAPPHIIIATGDPSNRGEGELERLFHESAHLLMATVEREIDRHCAEKGVQVPPDLWHALLFYTAGEVARAHLGADYTPYAYRTGMYTRSPEWAAYEHALKAEWQPYLDGKAEFNVALGRVVDALQLPSDKAGR